MSLFRKKIQSPAGVVLELEKYSIGELVRSHLRNCLFLIPTMASRREAAVADRTYFSHVELWEAVINEDLSRTDVKIRLDQFFLFEWLPRSPGLYHTDHGRWSRENARQHIHKQDGQSTIYNPYGKLSMLEGGIGNVRLKPILLEGQKYWMMSACTNGNCEEGFPVAIPEHLYNREIEAIKRNGVVTRDMVGQLEYIPDEIKGIYLGYSQAPKVYLKILECRAPRRMIRPLDELNVNVAVSFLSQYEDKTKFYASYVGFDPSIKDALKERSLWMDEKYVRNWYNGKIVTDFDQQKTWFADAIFGLDKVMKTGTGNFDLSAIEPDVKSDLNYLLRYRENIILHVNEIRMETYNNNGGTVGIMGSGAHDNTVNQQILSTVNMQVLGNELAELKSAVMKAAAKNAENEEGFLEVNKVAEAEKAAKINDQPGLIKAVKSFGKFTLELAKSVGTEVLAGVIAHAMHLPG